MSELSKICEKMAQQSRDCQAAHMLFGAKLQEYNAACTARNWRHADTVRQDVLTAVDEVLDTIAMAGRLIEMAERAEH